MLKHFVFVLLAVFLIVSCGENQSKIVENSSDSLLADTMTSAGQKDSILMAPNKKFSFTELIKGIPEKEEGLTLDEKYFDDYSSIMETKKTLKSMLCAKEMLPDSIVCSDSIYFCWKISMNEYTLLNLMTTDWNAKGPSVMYHLLTINNKTGEMMDCMPEWAASYSVSIENPNGGTSAGVRYTIGTLEINPALMITTKSWESEYQHSYGISSEGYFVDPYAIFEAEKDLQ